MAGFAGKIKVGKVYSKIDRTIRNSNSQKQTGTDPICRWFSKFDYRNSEGDEAII